MAVRRLLAAIPSRTFNVAVATVEAEARRLGSGYLKQERQDDLEEWVAARVLAAVTAYDAETAGHDRRMDADPEYQVAVCRRIVRTDARLRWPFMAAFPNYRAAELTHEKKPTGRKHAGTT